METFAVERYGVGHPACDRSLDTLRGARRRLRFHPQVPHLSPVVGFRKTSLRLQVPPTRTDETQRACAFSRSRSLAKTSLAGTAFTEPSSSSRLRRCTSSNHAASTSGSG